MPGNSVVCDCSKCLSRISVSPRTRRRHRADDRASLAAAGAQGVSGSGKKEFAAAELSTPPLLGYPDTSMSTSSLGGYQSSNVTERSEATMLLLSAILKTSHLRKALIKLPDNRAQLVIDYLHSLLLEPSLLMPWLRKHSLIALRDLSKESLLYPHCYFLKDITFDSLESGGAFSDVYKGRHGEQHLCLKVVRLNQKSDIKKMLKIYAKEAILWGQLNHPNITPFYGIYYRDEFRRQICLVSPWMRNGNLVEYLKNNPSASRSLLIYDIAAGMEYLHGEKIIHSDIKGANILVNDLKRACITDFGLSFIRTDHTLAYTLAATTVHGFSSRWAAPELLEEDSRTTFESDVWAIGCVFYEVLTGLLPFHKLKDLQITRKLMNGGSPAETTSVSSSDPVESAIWELVGFCWAQYPVSRPTCQQISEKLKRIGLGRDQGEMPEDVWSTRSFQVAMRANEVPLDLDAVEPILNELLDKHRAGQGDIWLEAGIFNLLEAGVTQSTAPGWLKYLMTRRPEIRIRCSDLFRRNAEKSRVDQERSSSVRTTVEAVRRIDEDLKEFFWVRNLDEAELYFTALPTQFHHNLVNKLASRAVESKERDAQLVSDLFTRLTSRNLCTPAALREGLTPVAQVISDIAIDAPLAAALFATMAKGAGLDEVQLARLGSTGISEEVVRQIRDNSNEIFVVRNLDEAEARFTLLPALYHPKFIDKVVSVAVESKEADAQLVSDLFARLASKNLCNAVAFEEGLTPVAEIIDDIAIDAPKSFNLFATMVKGAGLHDDRLSLLASKSVDGEKLLALLSCNTSR